MKRLAMTAVVGAALVLSGCYHAVINTGRPSNGETKTIPWAHGFIVGLVPPAEVDTKAKCPNGVASVETQMTFLNGLVAALTYQLYTPMQITYTCAK